LDDATQPDSSEPEGETPLKLTVKGAAVEVDDRHAKTPLLWVLRDVLAMHQGPGVVIF
jgi:hypothetical protein